MKKEELILFLTDAISMEDEPTLNNLADLGSMIGDSDMPNELKSQIIGILDTLKTESVHHSASFSQLLSYAVREARDDF